MKTLFVTLIVAVTFSVFAKDLPKADKEVMKEIVEFCKEMADEEAVAATELKEFMLKCVNNELESEGFAPVKKLKD